MKKLSNLPGLVVREPLEISVVPTSRILQDQDSNRSPFKPFKALSFLLLYSTGDTGYHHIDFSRYSCRKGTLLLISKEQVHHFDPHLPMEGFLIIFSEKFFESCCHPADLTLYEHHLYLPAMQLNSQQEQTVSSLVFQLKETFDAKSELFIAQLLQGWLRILLYTAERIRQSNQTSEKAYYYRKDFIRFLELLNNHILENRQVKFYAGEMEISTKKLNRITQEITGQPAKHYINELFLLYTRRLLINRSLSVKEIAYRTGFDAPTNFVKFFKTYTGSTPAEFRRQY